MYPTPILVVTRRGIWFFAEQQFRSEEADIPIQAGLGWGIYRSVNNSIGGRDHDRGHPNRVRCAIGGLSHSTNRGICSSSVRVRH